MKQQKFRRGERVWVVDKINQKIKSGKITHIDSQYVTIYGIGKVDKQNEWAKVIFKNNEHDRAVRHLINDIRRMINNRNEDNKIYEKRIKTNNCDIKKFTAKIKRLKNECR